MTNVEVLMCNVKVLMSNVEVLMSNLKVIMGNSLLRYNDYTRDPLSKCDCSPPYSAINAISSRSDLNPANGSYPIPILGSMLSGGIDYKATNSG